ncbi:MAG: DUF5666 domain-containing protein [Actinomycetota bacterium]|nr:DUF5666 domain-containing protein [Actinomycetota bacterium]
MKKFVVLIGASLLLLAFATSALAHPGSLLRPRHLRGEVVSLDTSASTVSFLCRDDTTRTLTVAGTTKILKNGRWAAFDKLALGDYGTAKYVITTDTAELKALKIIVRTPIMRGKISEITSDTITLKRPKSSRTFTVDADTKIKRNGAIITLADLKVRDQAKISYNKLEGGGFVARSIKAAGKKH